VAATICCKWLAASSGQIRKHIEYHSKFQQRQMAQANELIPRTEEANPLNHVHINTISEYEALLVERQEAWAIICSLKKFEQLLTRRRVTSANCTPSAETCTHSVGSAERVYRSFAQSSSFSAEDGEPFSIIVECSKRTTGPVK
jgi:hypothetical protein